MSDSLEEKLVECVENDNTAGFERILTSFDFRVLKNNDRVTLPLVGALGRACEKGNADIVRLILAQQSLANVGYHCDNKTNADRPLLTAAYHGHINVVKTLLSQSDIDINRKNGAGATAFHMAAMSNNLNIVKLLVRDSRLRLEDTYTVGIPALHYAARNGHTEVVMYLLDLYPISVITKSYYGRTASQAGAENGNYGISKMILSHVAQQPHYF